jgi:hypothetical protein
MSHLPTKNLAFGNYHIYIILGCFALVACSSRETISTQTGVPMALPENTATEFSLNVEPSPTISLPPNTLEPASTDTPQLVNNSPTQNSPINSTTLPPITSTPPPPDGWMSLPVIPTVSDATRSIYQRGLEMGNDPHAFSKIGDCQSITTYYLTYFDMPGYYNLGDYSYLQDTIDWFSGSFSRESLSVKGGFNAAAVLSPLRANTSLCNPNETPIACEFRLHNPSIAIISLEEWWAGHPENYEIYMRQIIEYSIQEGVVPIIATKADNLEGNNLINQTIARLAQEYNIPIWNFWLAVQPLPNHGLLATNSSGEVDMFHLTHSEGYYFYNNPQAIQSGWSMRNLTALQALDAVRRGLTGQP